MNKIGMNKREKMNEKSIWTRFKNDINPRRNTKRSINLKESIALGLIDGLKSKRVKVWNSEVFEAKILIFEFLFFYSAGVFKLYYSKANEKKYKYFYWVD